MERKYEVQFKDGFGAWRRWSLVSSWDAAEKSLERLYAHLGPVLATSHGRIRERA